MRYSFQMGNVRSVLSEIILQSQNVELQEQFHGILYHIKNEKIVRIQQGKADVYKMGVGLYIRVSTQEQADEGYSVGEQEERLKNYCKAMSWQIHKIYVDPGYTGSNTDRPGLQNMIDDIKAGQLDKVVVYKLDRLSRSQLDTLYLIEKVFIAHGTDFVSMTENFDTSTTMGRFMIGMLAVFAQLERDRINERTMMGKEARAKSGKWHGGSTQPIGYDYDPKTEDLTINDYEALQIRELYKLFLDGVPLRATERIFAEKGYTHKHGTWDPKSMRRVMANKINIGYIKHRGKWYPGEHEPLIDDDTFARANTLLENRAAQFAASGYRPGAQTTYLGGLLYCKHCGGKFAKDQQILRGDRPNKLMYICNSRSKRVKKMIKDPNCKNKRWEMIALDNVVFDEIRKLSADPAHIQHLRDKKAKEDGTPEKIAILKKEIDKINAQISRFMDLYGVGTFTIDQVSEKVNPLNEQKNGIEKEIAALKGGGQELTAKETYQIVKDFESILQRGDFDEIRLLIETLIYNIIIDNDIVQINWKFL